MKVVLEFNLDKPEEKLALMRANKATDAYLTLHELEQEFRKIWKYEELSEDSKKMIEKVRSIFYNTIQEYDIQLDRDLE